jgi:signal transduction histidine kinase
VVRRIPIRAKVAGALAIPLVALVVGAAMGAGANAARASQVMHQADLATASIGHAGLISALQDERNLALIEMLGLSGRIQLDPGDFGSVRDATDAAHTALHHEIADQADTLRDDYAVALESLDQLDGVRARVDAATGAGTGEPDRDEAHEVFSAYSDMIGTLFASHDRFSLMVDDAALRQGDDLVHYSSHATDAVAQLVERLLFWGSSPGGIDEPEEAARVAEAARDVERNNAVVRTKGTGPYAQAADTLLASPRVTGLLDYADQAIRTGEVDPDALLEVTPLGPEGGYSAFRDQVAGVLDNEATRVADEADARRRLYWAAALVVLAGAVGVAYVVSRSITRPLRHMSQEAGATAGYRLPAAVQDILDAPVGTDVAVPELPPRAAGPRDEVGDVARALDDLQRSALTLAVEQAALRRNVAESYVNLGRRSQNLLSRLLDSVGELGRTETDPDRLDQIYRLEHLANRIRRNAESLLVLSEPVAPARWKPPVQVADVVRAALGEIENYERVVVRTLEPAMVRGGSTTDLAHILAELVENALRHSPPRELVEVSGHTGERGYEISVVDHGLGMTPEDLERANQRLAGAESFTVTPARYMGHYVTAVLAARHGVSVRLQGSVVAGITAQVTLPPTLLTDHPDHPAASRPPGESDPLAGIWPDDPAPERPTAHDVRAAVALLRTRTAAPARETVTAGLGAPAVDAIVPRHWPARSERDRPVAAAPGTGSGRRVGGPTARPTETAGRTASGLVRRVPTSPPPATAAARPEMERFLASLAGRTPPAPDHPEAGNGPDGPGR